MSRISRSRGGHQLRAAVVGSSVLLPLALLAACSSSSKGASPSPSTLKRDFQLRPVLSIAAAGSAGCPTATKDAAAASPVTACSGDGKTTYSLGPAGVKGDQITSWKIYNALAQVPGKDEVDLNPAGQAGLAALTQSLTTKTPPQSSLALYGDGVVGNTATVTEPITTGKFTIVGHVGLGSLTLVKRG
jgi:hypothetical protein